MTAAAGTALRSIGLTGRPQSRATARALRELCGLALFAGLLTLLARLLALLTGLLATALAGLLRWIAVRLTLPHEMPTTTANPRPVPLAQNRFRPPSRYAFITGAAASGDK